MSASSAVVVGDLAGGSAAVLIGPGLAAWGGVTERYAPAERIDPTTVQAVVVDRPGAAQTQLGLGHPAVGREHPDFAALTIAAYVLGGTLTSRIDALLREGRGYTYGMRASLVPTRRGGSFRISGSVATGVTEPALLDLRGVLTTALAGGLTDEECTAAAAYLTLTSPLRWETPSALARQTATVVSNDLDPGWTTRNLAQQRAVTPAAVNRAMREHLDPTRLSIAAVGDAGVVAPALQAAGWTGITVVPA